MKHYRKQYYPRMRAAIQMDLKELAGAEKVKLSHRIYAAGLMGFLAIPKGIRKGSLINMHLLRVGGLIEAACLISPEFVANKITTSLNGLIPDLVSVYEPNPDNLRNGLIAFGVMNVAAYVSKGIGTLAKFFEHGANEAFDRSFPSTKEVNFPRVNPFKESKSEGMLLANLNSKKE